MRDKERIVEDVYEGQVEEGRGCLWGQGGEGVFMRDEWRRVEGVYEGQGKEGGGCLWGTRGGYRVFMRDKGESIL